MKILALARASSRTAEVEEEASDLRLRTGQFTSGIVSTRQGEQMALFFTGRRHAGENLAQVLARRAAGLQAPIRLARELCPLIGIENLGARRLQRPLQRRQAKGAL